MTFVRNKLGLFGPLAVLALAAAVSLGMERGARRRSVEESRLNQLMKQLRPLHTPLGKPQPGDWLETHSETGQTFPDYVRSGPVTARGKRRVLYVQPLGDFDKTQRKIVDLTADFLGRYFGLRVKIRDDLPLALIPDSARRKHPTWGMDQVLSTYVLDKVLSPRLPSDAAAFIALTSSDLWPGEGWNFVFGQASLEKRVGVWSLFRNGDPTTDDESFRLCLVRTVRTASHETGHMFSLNHCTLFECNMCGSNNREEADRRPLALCPECLAKVCWATGVDPRTRFEQLAAFAKENGLEAEERQNLESLQALGPN